MINIVPSLLTDIHTDRHVMNKLMDRHFTKRVNIFLGIVDQNVRFCCHTHINHFNNIFVKLHFVLQTSIRKLHIARGLPYPLYHLSVVNPQCAVSTVRAGLLYT